MSATVAAIASLPIASILMLVIPAAVVLDNPGHPDMCAVLGASFSTVLALTEARMKDKTWGHTASVFVASLFIGATGPGILHSFLSWRGWIDEKTAQFIGWQVWAMAGFFFGLNGWFLSGIIVKVIQRRAMSLFEEKIKEACFTCSPNPGPAIPGNTPHPPTKKIQ